jgi:arginyl-tRNA--protein-N-Asp/Glu arginylyltransferase
MNRPIELHPHRFFMSTRALPCPYLPGRVERKVVTDLATPNATEIYDNLARAGFRRSHSLAYRPACPSCTACVPVRIRVKDFEWSRSFRRIANRNADLTTRDMAGHATMEQYRLFTRYQRSRHSGSEMSSMSFLDFRAMIEDSPIDTRIIEFRDPEGSLVAVMLADRQIDAMSAVYSLFNPELDKRSLGTYMVLWLIKQAEANDLPYVYLGYWIEKSPKMSYKKRFRPLEGLTPDGWKTL